VGEEGGIWKAGKLEGEGRGRLATENKESTDGGGRKAMGRERGRGGMVVRLDAGKGVASLVAV
jgi:hypothetical protein